MLFVPIEQLFAQWPEQKIFRPGWPTDLVYFAVSHLGVQATVLLTLAARGGLLPLGGELAITELARRPARRPAVLRDPR